MKYLILSFLLLSACAHYQEPYIAPLTEQEKADNAYMESLPTPPSQPTLAEQKERSFWKGFGHALKTLGHGMQQQPQTTNCTSQVIGQQVYTHCR